MMFCGKERFWLKILIFIFVISIGAIFVLFFILRLKSNTISPVSKQESTSVGSAYDQMDSDMKVALNYTPFSSDIRGVRIATSTYWFGILQGGKFDDFGNGGDIFESWIVSDQQARKDDSVKGWSDTDVEVGKDEHGLTVAFYRSPGEAVAYKTMYRYDFSGKRIMKYEHSNSDPVIIDASGATHTFTLQFRGACEGMYDPGIEQVEHKIDFLSVSIDQKKILIPGQPRVSCSVEYGDSYGVPSFYDSKWMNNEFVLSLPAHYELHLDPERVTQSARVVIEGDKK